MGSAGQASVWVGIFWGFLDVSLRASGTQLGLNIFVKKFLKQIDKDMKTVLDTAWDRVHFLLQTLFWHSRCPNRPFKCLDKPYIITCSKGQCVVEKNVFFLTIETLSPKYGPPRLS